MWALHLFKPVLSGLAALASSGLEAAGTYYGAYGFSFSLIGNGSTRAFPRLGLLHA